jgi:hypothetical protein
LVGIVFTDDQLQVTGLLAFLLAGVRLVGFDFASPARNIGESAVDLRCAAFVFVGLTTFLCGAVFRFARLVRMKAYYTIDPTLEILSKRRSDMSNDDFRVLFDALLMLLGIALVTCAPPLQLIDWALLGPIWALEGIVLTLLSIVFYDVLLSCVGLLVFAVAVARLICWDFPAQSRLVDGTSWDLRFVVMEFTGLLAIVAGAMYWLIPRVFPKRKSDSSQLALGAYLAGAGNVVLMLGLLCQMSGRGVLVLWTIDAMLLWGIGFWFNQQILRWYAAALAVFMVGGRLIHDGYSLDGPYTLLTNARLASMCLAAAMFFAAGALYRRQTNRSANVGQQISDLFTHGLRNLDETELDPMCGILGNFILLAAISFEIHSWYAAAISSGRLLFSDMHMAEMATYSIVWAIYAAIVVAVGFAFRYPLFRFLGLAAFGVIALKVFFVDLESLRWLPRVLALAVLGLMLMGVSFLYQKYSTRVQQAGQ